jgi:homoserine kinase
VSCVPSQMGLGPGVSGLPLKSAQTIMTSLHLRLPATSANLGPGFDALGLALALFLDLKATAAEAFTITAAGRNALLTAQLDRNLILTTYADLAPAGTPLALTIHNDIPLGMGCGSSAAALLAGVILANHFGALALTPQQILEEACRREGHPDNVAACFFGGLTASASDPAGTVTTATFAAPGWRILLALPTASLATSEARALLPAQYSRADAVRNIQSTALLVSAFALNRPELLLSGTADRIHQPYRAAACPLLPLLLPLAGTAGIYSVTLSGAGPSVLLIADPAVAQVELEARIRAAAGDPALEVLETSILPLQQAPAAAL